MKGSSLKSAVLVEREFQDLEVTYPYYRLKEAGISVFLVGAKAGDRVAGKFGYPVVVEMGLDEAMGMKFDCVVIPGGWAPDYMRRDPRFVEFLKKCWSEGAVVASICHGGWLLASAGIARGRRLTSFFAIKDDLVNAGAAWVDEEVVVDGNLVTSRKPEDLPAFMRAVLELLAQRG